MQRNETLRDVETAVGLILLAGFDVGEVLPDMLQMMLKDGVDRPRR